MNSIKYGKENGTTEISIEDLVENRIIVRIQDDGEGIENQHIARLFERFFRVDKSGARSEGGSGLGLSIVKHIIERHNEKIFVKSEFGKGSEFSFTLEKRNKSAQFASDFSVEKPLYNFIFLNNLFQNRVAKQVGAI